MCGLVGVAGAPSTRLAAAMDALRHRGPDASGAAEFGDVALGHLRLSIIDLSEAGRQPMSTADGRYSLVFNGEIYNYLELRAELSDHTFRTATDSEVLLAAWARWGPAALDRLVGMFAFAVWDARDRSLVLARDRFGVKPLYWADLPDGTIGFASEIKALHALGVARRPDETAWASFLALGLHDHSERTFWSGVRSVPPGSTLTLRDGDARVARWYDLAAAAPAEDERPWREVEEEYTALLLDSVRLRFRADVPVGINLSGGLDSSALLAAVHGVQGPDSEVRAFTFVCGDDRYDELPWVDEMLRQTRHPSTVCLLRADDVPALAAEVSRVQDEPYGGIPTLAYAGLFRQAKAEGVTVLLDGQGMDEQWAGYDYYRRLSAGGAPSTVQGMSSAPTRAAALDPAFAALAEPLAAGPEGLDPLRAAQYRDLRFTKLQRALRFNDRVSMLSSCELREPFLDHRLVELAFAQPADRKVDEQTGKLGLRRILGGALPAKVVEAPKRPLQTPQREWLRGPLAPWARDQVEAGLAAAGAWFDAGAVRDGMAAFVAGEGDSAYHVWQWISVGLLLGDGAA